MLQEIYLENFILIKQLRIELTKGLIALTGETGAGKSLMIQAIKLAMGEKAQPQHISTGAEQAVIQLAFEATDEIKGVLAAQDIPCDEDYISIRRILQKNGKSRIYINGVLAPLTLLKTISSCLISIAGQHEYQRLLNSENHCLWLDTFLQLEQELGTLKDLHAQTVTAQKALKKARDAAQNASHELSEALRVQKELNAIDPKPNEDEALEREITVLKQTNALRELGDAVYSTLYMERNSVQKLLRDCIQRMEKMSAIDDRLTPITDALKDTAYRAEDAALGIRDYLEGLHTDSSKLEAMEDRYHALRELKRRHGPTLEDVLTFRKDQEKRIFELEHLQEDTQTLQNTFETLEAKLISQANRISRLRKQGAHLLETAILKELAHLKMEQTRFKIEILTPEKPTLAHISTNGMDEVQFLFSPNVGEPLRPLTAIASGGELSRVMLALRAALARNTGVETIVFDEIDTGLGGEVAERVGQKLKALASQGQVIVVTHFPQIACLADQHLLAYKKTADGGTVTTIHNISNEERMEELSRMLGGGKEAAMRYVEHLVSQTQQNT
ncbi:MAG: DNA repair protein RecN [Dissulfuribacterales bacterium]